MLRISRDIVREDCCTFVMDISYKGMAYHINNAIDANVFLDISKLADVSPIFKNGKSTTDVNYRPISVLSAISKMYERLFSKQMLPHISQYLSDLLCLWTIPKRMIAYLMISLSQNLRPMVLAWVASECFTATLRHENKELESTQVIVRGSISHQEYRNVQSLVRFCSIFT